MRTKIKMTSMFTKLMFRAFEIFFINLISPLQNNPAFIGWDVRTRDYALLLLTLASYTHSFQRRLCQNLYKTT